MMASRTLDQFDEQLDDHKLFELVFDAFDVLSKAGRPLSSGGVAEVVAHVVPSDRELIDSAMIVAESILTRTLH